MHHGSIPVSVRSVRCSPHGGYRNNCKIYNVQRIIILNYYVFLLRDMCVCPVAGRYATQRARGGMGGGRGRWANGWYDDVWSVLVALAVSVLELGESRWLTCHIVRRTSVICCKFWLFLCIFFRTFVILFTIIISQRVNVTPSSGEITYRAKCRFTSRCRLVVL